MTEVELLQAIFDHLDLLIFSYITDIYYAMVAMQGATNANTQQLRQAVQWLGWILFFQIAGTIGWNFWTVVRWKKGVEQMGRKDGQK